MWCTARTIVLSLSIVGLGSLAGCWPDADEIRNQRTLVDAAADLAELADVVGLGPAETGRVDVASPVPDAIAERAGDAPRDGDIRETGPRLEVAADVDPPDAPRSPDLGLAPEVYRVDAATADDVADARVAVDAQATLDAGVEASRDAAGADGGRLDGGRPSVADRCAAWAQAWCARYQSCAPAGFSYTYLSMGTCVERMSLDCGIYAGLAGATWPTADCARGTGGQSCDDFINELRPTECYNPGHYPDGELCASLEQCAGLRCTVANGASCGRCGSLSALNGACDSDSDCQRGLLCGNNVCVSPSGLDATCSAARPCLGSLLCSTAGKCAKMGDIGARCTDSYDCDFQVGGAACNSDTGRCVAFQSASGNCGFQSDGTYTFCGAGGTCMTDGTCMPPAAPGQACDLDYGPDCLYPASCDSKLGLCTMPSPSSTCVAPISGSATNVAAELTGALVGDTRTPNASLRKVLATSVTGIAPTNLEVRTVWAISGGSSTLYFVIPIANIGSRILCGIQASKIVINDEAGNALVSDLGYLKGSVAAVGSSWQQDCLKPHEVGYILGLSLSTDGTNPFAAAASMRLSLAEPVEGTAVAVRVQPTGYTVTSDSSGSLIAASVQNTGTLDVVLGSFSAYILFDDVGPVRWGFLAAPDNVTSLAVGESTVLTTPSYSAVPMGSGTHVRIFVEVSQP